MFGIYFAFPTISDVFSPIVLFWGRSGFSSFLTTVAKFNSKNSSLLSFFVRLYSLPTVKDWPPSIVLLFAILSLEKMLFTLIFLSWPDIFLVSVGLYLIEAVGLRKLSKFSPVFF